VLDRPIAARSCASVLSHAESCAATPSPLTADPVDRPSPRSLADPGIAGLLNNRYRAL
jgi:hypothetical protein